MTESAEIFRWPVRVYYEDTDNGVMMVWTCELRDATVWT